MHMIALVQKGEIRLMTEWLRTLSTSDTVEILAGETISMEEVARATDGNPQVRGVSPMPEEAEALQRVSEAASRRVTLFHQGASVELRFLPGTRVPRLDNRYQDVERLWCCGFRTFDLFSFFGTQSFKIPVMLDALRNCHAGQRAFVVGNGPSLNELNMSYLRDEITFGANRCYLGYEKWGFQFSYWSIMDRLQAEEYALEYRDNIPEDTIKFFPFEYLPLFPVPCGCPVNFSYDSRPPIRFSDMPTILHLGYTVTYMQLQIAAIMGCNPIILIGVDHRYNLAAQPPNLKEHPASFTTRLRARAKDHPLFKAWQYYNGLRRPNITSSTPKPPELWSAADAKQPTHFSDAYTSGPKKFVRPRPEKAEEAFIVAKAWADEKGVEILNATPESALEVFKKVDYTKLF